MIRNYFKIAVRNIKRNYTISILNISGMAIGMACAVLILVWVQEEWSYDRHFENVDNLYRVVSSGGDGSLSAVTPGPLGPALKEEYPEIVRSSRYIPGNLLSFKKEDEFIEESVTIADKDFLKMFNIEFIEGDINSALNDPRNMIISEKISDKYFGNEDPVGKTLTLTELNLVFTITGVIKSPRNSHLLLDFLIPIEFRNELGSPLKSWFWACYNYIELKKETDCKIFENKIRDFLKKHVEESYPEISLQNIKTIHLFSSGKYTRDISGHGDITDVRIMGLIAVLILLIACINFMNLSTAQSARRVKEIGIRKVAGSNKRKIIFQFLGESLLIVFVANIIAMILVELILPGFNNLTGKQLTINYHSTGLYLGLIAIVLFCGLLAGYYPALYLSSLKPLDTMKGVFTKNPGNAQFRRILVILQFSLSVLLIICTLIVRNQVEYIQNKNLGFNKDNIGYFVCNTGAQDIRLEGLKKELSNNPDILSITMGSNPVNIESAGMGTVNGFDWAGKNEDNDILFYLLSGDADYARTFQLEIKKGRFFSSEFSTDNSAAIINETAAEMLGFKDPLGEILTTPWGSKLNIIGVVKNFHFKSLHCKIEPLIITMGTNASFFIRMKPEKIASTIDFVMKSFTSYNLPFRLNLHFLDDDFDNLYRTEQRMSKILDYFSVLTIIISCLGLIGLSLFMTQSRTKEIGIRKINGAKSGEIFSLLSGEYVMWVMISIIIACPFAWIIMDEWLQNFAYRINMSWWIFALAGVLALFIALLTISWQSYKAAWKNPVESLRYE